ncbi:replication initiator [Streptomyces sp. NPDC055134]
MGTHRAAKDSELTSASPPTGRARKGRTVLSAGTAPSEELGTALDPATYDYVGAVLWNNHAGPLWRYVTIYLPREPAARVGITQREPKEQLRISYGRVAEYQKSGAIHFHAVIRFDGPDGPDPAPGLGHPRNLDDALKAAAARARIEIPVAGDQSARGLRWGTQLDVRPILAFGAGQVTRFAPTERRFSVHG